MVIRFMRGVPPLPIRPYKDSLIQKIETYSPRKGFTDLMLQKGFSLEDISTFLGHCDINTTWKHYKDKYTFKLPAS